MEMQSPAVPVIKRNELVTLLRAELKLIAGEDRSVCSIAAAKGIFCHGFQRYGDDELKRRYGWIFRKQPSVSRVQLEEIADRWQLARQETTGLATSCDVQQLERDTCRGWDDFTNDQLARFYFELTGRNVFVDRSE